MRNRSIVALSAFLFVLGVAGVARSATKEEAEADEKWLLATWDKHRKILDVNLPISVWTPRIAGTTMPFHDPFEAQRGFKETLDQLDAFVAQSKEIKDRIAEIDKRYPDPKVNVATLIARAKAPEKKPSSVYGVSSVDQAFKGLRDGPARLDKRCTEVAASIVAYVDAFLKDVTWVQEPRIRSSLELAQRIKPSDALKARLANLAAELTKHKADNKKKIDENAFPANLKSFAGPGKADELAKTALAFLTDKDNEKRVSDNELVINFQNGEWRFRAVAVEDNWYAAQTDALGKVTQWGVYIYVAVTNKELEADDVAAVYQFAILCPMHQPQGAPWARAFCRGDVGNLPQGGYTRLSALPKR